MIEASIKPGVVANRVPGRRELLTVDPQYQELFARLNGTVFPHSRSVGVIGCSHGVGSSTVAAHVALAAAQTGETRVLLVDANSQHPSLSRNIQAAGTAGWSEVVCGLEDVEACLRHGPTDNMYVIPAGSPSVGLPVNTSAMSDLIESLESEFGLVILDLPPVTADACDRRLIGSLGGVLLVIDSGKTRAEEGKSAKRLIDRAGGSLLGVVLNRQNNHMPDWLDRRL